MNEVPTWNYGYVRVYGVPRMIQDDGEKNQLLQKLVHKYESSRKKPWCLDSLPKEHIENQVKKVLE